MIPVEFQIFDCRINMNHKFSTIAEYLHKSLADSFVEEEEHHINEIITRTSEPRFDRSFIFRNCCFAIIFPIVFLQKVIELFIND